MRTLLIIGRKHGAKTIEVVAGPSSNGTELNEIKARFKKESIVQIHPTHEAMELWSSDSGRIKSLKFTSSEAERNRLAAAKKAEEALAQKAKEAKAKEAETKPKGK